MPGYGVEVGPCLPAKTRRCYLNRAKYIAINHSARQKLIISLKMFTFSSTGTYSKEQIKLLKEMEEKCNLLMKLDKDLFNQKYINLIRFSTLALL